MLGTIQGPVSLTTDQVMFPIVSLLSPRLLNSEDCDVPPVCPPAMTLNETVLGAMANKAFLELAVPFSVIGVVQENFATLFVVLTTISLESRPTVVGLKLAFRLNV
jgi:hypothetical protein